MPLYAYKAFDPHGKQVKGLKEAESPNVLRSLLRKEGIFVTELKEVQPKESEGQGLSRSIDLSALFVRIKPQEVGIFTRQLATLLRAGIPLAESLAALVEQVENPKIREIVADVRRQVNEGASLADAMAAHPKMFPELYVNMVRSGEAAGNLDQVLFQLADFTESQVNLRNKVLSALLYPAIMVVVGGGILTLLMVKVVPQIVQLFEDMKQGLPWNTKLLIAMSDFLGSYWWVIFLSVIAAAYALRRWKRTPSGREKWDRFRLWVPIFGDLNRKVAISRFASSLGTMLSAGVSLLKALDIVKYVVGNAVLEDVIEKAKVAIQEGESIAAPLARSGEFPPLVVHMIAVGERSGQLETMLANVAAAYQNEVEMKLSRLTTLLEPIMILVMGGAVAFVVFSILLPILQMNQMVQ